MSRIWLCIAVIALSFPVASLVDRIVPDPYMDEIFHVPQMQQYCKGNFGAWDPMITTPPGLYLITCIYWLILRLGEAASIWSAECSPAVLRHVNIFFSVICAVLFREITLHLEPDSGPTVASLKALALACYPLHWFFTFLFYTDVGSTTAVLAMYLACLKRAYWMSAVLSLVAILFRQTNIVWTFFVLCVSILDFLFKPSSEAAKPLSSVDKISDKEAIRESAKHRNSVNLQSRSKTGVKNADVAKDLMEESLYILRQGWQKRSSLVGQFLPFTVPIVCFLVFVAYNGSIVLGAKEAHKVSPHFAQVLYFSVVTAFALAPIHLNSSFIRENLLKLLKPMQSGLLGYFFATFVGILSCIHFFSFAHPYLVSDNRHYTFYIWRRIINAHWSSKYLLSITYTYSWWLIFRLLERKERKIWQLVFFGAVAAVLVPTPLIEFRYYTVPLYIIALHTPSRTQKDYSFWVLIFLQYTLVNLVTMYVFLYKPFYSPNEVGAQRFIW